MQKNNNNNLEEPSTRHHGEMQIGIVKGPWLNCKNIGNYHKNIIAHLADQENQQRNANWFAKRCLYRLISNSTLWVLANFIKSFLQWVFLNFPMYVLLYMYLCHPCSSWELSNQLKYSTFAKIFQVSSVKRKVNSLCTLFQCSNEVSSP